MVFSALYDKAIADLTNKAIIMLKIPENWY